MSFFVSSIFTDPSSGPSSGLRSLFRGFARGFLLPHILAAPESVVEEWNT